MKSLLLLKQPKSRNGDTFLDNIMSMVLYLQRDIKDRAPVATERSLNDKAKSDLCVPSESVTRQPYHATRRVIYPC